MEKSTIYDISESIIFGESMGLSKPIKYQQIKDSIEKNKKCMEKYKEYMEKYKECMEKYKEYKFCKYLLDEQTFSKSFNKK